VADSLNRTRMTGRHFLSLLTGYSTFSMALATLYCQIIGKNHDGVKSSLSYELRHNGFVPRSEASDLGSPETTRKSSRDDKILNMALQKLDNVARQFPRMQEYKQTIQIMRAATSGHDSPTPESHEDLETFARSVGPSHLRQLAMVICFRHRALSGRALDLELVSDDV
jgi:hypothetical protein